MPKNTVVFIAALAIFAALVAGVNIGRSVSTQPEIQNGSDQAPPSVSPTPTPVVVVRYESFSCGIAFDYPKTLTKMDVQTGGAMLIDTASPSASVAIACQNDIPRPALVESRIELFTVRSATTSAQPVQGKLYHDASEKDGTPTDKLIFTHPKSKKDVFISGYGTAFHIVMDSLVFQ